MSSKPGAAGEETSKEKPAPSGTPLPEELTGWKAAVINVVDGKIFTGIMLVATVFALFGTDIYMLIGPPVSQDPIVYSLVFVTFILFVAEFTAFSVCKPGYLFSFFFWLDFVAALSLLPDTLLLFNVAVLSGSGSSLTVARAGRAARAGTRAARIVRVIKLIALVKKQKGGKEEEEEADTAKPSKIGTKLADLITQKVIVIVGLMLVASSLLDLIGTEESTNFNNNLKNLGIVYSSYYSSNATKYAVFQEYFAKFITDHDDGSGEYSGSDYTARIASFKASRGGNFPAYGDNWNSDDSKCRDHRLRYIKAGTKDLWCFDKSYDDLRVSPSELIIAESGDFEMVLDHQHFAKGQALVQIVQITFIIFLLGASSALFAQDAEKLVIAPLEKMASLVRKLSSNPLAQIEESEEGQYETDFVESALKKFGKLLQIAFGEAGAEIIGKNLSADGDLNIMIAGRKMRAIFGFCDIRNFTDCTECLQEDVMVFVNRIAEYVHKAVKDNEGAPNKNIGDAFLLVWRLPDEGDLSNLTIADHALQSFIRTILETGASPELKKMTDHPKIQERLPGYYVRMGFGLHVGWAIEGAIGSTLKIDASYLSPNVNMASRLEAATKQFGTAILVSGQFFKLLSSDVQELCRKIDRVTVKGSVEPLELYTYDVPPSEATTVEEVQLEPGVPFFEQFAPSTSASYRRDFAMGVEYYLQGKWGQSKGQLEKCLAQWPEDGPAKNLMEIMGNKGFNAPADWPGYRELTEK